MRDLLLDVLATYRMTRLVTTDELLDGPRNAVTKWADDPPMEDRRWARRQKVATLISCSWCAGVWLGFGVSLARRRFARQWAPVAEALALAALTGLIASHED